MQPFVPVCEITYQNHAKHEPTGLFVLTEIGRCDDPACWSIPWYSCACFACTEPTISGGLQYELYISSGGSKVNSLQASTGIYGEKFPEELPLGP